MIVEREGSPFYAEVEETDEGVDVAIWERRIVWAGTYSRRVGKITSQWPMHVVLDTVADVLRWITA